MFKKIKDWFDFYILSVKHALKQMSFLMLIMWILLMLPVLIFYKITGLFVWLHNQSADIYNKLDDWILTLK